MAINQADIVDGNIALSNIERYKLNAGAELESATAASVYSIGSGLGGSPLQIKSNGTGNTGWVDEQDIELFNQSFTNTIVVWNSGTASSISINVTNGTLVGLFGAGTWTATGTMTQTREGPGGAGSQNAALMAGGVGSVVLGTAELFNGSTWTATGTMTQTRQGPGGAGSQNAALMAGGSGTVVLGTAETFNGSTWTVSGTMNQTRFGPGGAGSQNAGLMAGGLGNVVLGTAETFNGSTWTATGTMTQTREFIGGAGSQNAGLVAGGFGGAVLGTAEFFNGSTWTATGTMIQTRQGPGPAGSQNATLMAGGLGGGVVLGTAELFNGSTWTVTGTMTQTREYPGGAGSQNAALMAGGIGNVVLGTAELHAQTLYRPLTWDNLRCASNVGIALGVSGNTCNVKLQGFAQNMSISSTAGYYYVLTKDAITSTNIAPYQLFKQFPDAEDWVIGIVNAITTSLHVLNNPILPFDEIKAWG